MRRLLSLALAVAMMVPAFASVAEAAIGTWLSPPPGKLITADKVEVAIGFNTQSKTKVTSLQLFIDGKFYGRKILVEPTPRGVCSFWWDTSRASEGSHDILVKIFAGDKVISKVSGTGTVRSSGGGGSLLDTRPPTVKFANIKSGDVLKGEAKVRLDASDDSGQDPLVSLLVDDVLKLVKNTRPYSYNLDTTTYRDGDHELRTYAYDGAGNRSDPAVVKVSFSNNLQRPVVAAMTVDNDPEPIPDDDIVASLPPIIPVSAPPAIKTNSAARSDDSPARVASSPTAATPADPAIAAPRYSPTPRNVTDASSSGKVRWEDAKWSPIPVDSRPVEPAASESARASSVAPIAAPAIPPHKTAMPKTFSQPGAPAEPAAYAPPVTSGPVSVVVAHGPATELKSTDVAHVASGNLCAPAVPGFATEPDGVLLAMAPDIRAADVEGHAHPAVAAKPSIARSTKAKIEKSAVPASGEVKARDIFEMMGGVLLWDSTTRTVTVYVENMCIELPIGSKTARVNGYNMQLQSAPYIIDGRTIIDAQVYHQACALAMNMTTMGAAR